MGFGLRGYAAEILSLAVLNSLAHESTSGSPGQWWLELADSSSFPQPVGHISSQLCIQCHAQSLKSAIMEVFTPWKPANAARTCPKPCPCWRAGPPTFASTPLHRDQCQLQSWELAAEHAVSLNSVSIPVKYPTAYLVLGLIFVVRDVRTK